MVRHLLQNRPSLAGPLGQQTRRALQQLCPLLLLCEVPAPPQLAAFRRASRAAAARVQAWAGEFCARGSVAAATVPVAGVARACGEKAVVAAAAAVLAALMGRPVPTAALAFRAGVLATIGALPAFMLALCAAEAEAAHLGLLWALWRIYHARACWIVRRGGGGGCGGRSSAPQAFSLVVLRAT